ncbi:MAG: hypothetical protein HJJLKODD_00605 [Phycisphaerae bacterium]|nr:hypothetical protein [Phycisphaerae bacterium]
MHEDRPETTTPAHPAAAKSTDDRLTLWNNPLSMLGFMCVFISMLLLITFGLFSLVTPIHNQYFNIVGFMVLPGVLMFGLIITPFGAYLRIRHLRRRYPDYHPSRWLPKLDLADPRQRRSIKIFVSINLLLLPVLGVSGYQGYHYTDSVQFCAQACHQVMEPQATTFARSSHARVACAECHIGEGADWFVKSKLSGVRQVLAVWQNSFSRPIPPAIHHLRPARETCEHCHWPEQFYGAQLKSITHFGTDESNSRRDFHLLLKVGGGTQERVEGIHKHVAHLGKLEYVARDAHLQDIVWVRWHDPNGQEQIYRSDGLPATDPPPTGQLRQLDCMDCHNRAAHYFEPPHTMLNNALLAGQLDPAIPFIKREALRLLSQDYDSVEQADQQIAAELTDFYTAHYQSLAASQPAALTRSIQSVQQLYRQNVFPYMHVNWTTYPSNVGHLYSPGCFRCHDGLHVNQEGKPISHECRNCHTFLNPTLMENGENSLKEGEFIHPYERVGRHNALRCDQCHSGAETPAVTCNGCHQATDGLFTAAERWKTYALSASAMAGVVECDGCHNLEEPLSIKSIDEACVDCHEGEEKYVGLLERWQQQVSAAREKTLADLNRLAQSPAAGSAGLQQQISRWRSTLQELDQAGPLHNPDAALLIYQAVQNEMQSFSTGMAAGS